MFPTYFLLLFLWKILLLFWLHDVIWTPDFNILFHRLFHYWNLQMAIVSFTAYFSTIAKLKHKDSIMFILRMMKSSVYKNLVWIADKSGSLGLTTSGYEIDFKFRQNTFHKFMILSAFGGQIRKLETKLKTCWSGSLECTVKVPGVNCTKNKKWEIPLSFIELLKLYSRDHGYNLYYL